MAEFRVAEYFDSRFVEGTFLRLAETFDQPRNVQYFALAHVLAEIPKAEILSLGDTENDWHPKAIDFIAGEAVHNAFAFEIAGLYAAKFILDDRQLSGNLKQFAAAVLSRMHHLPTGMAARPPQDYLRKVTLGLAAGHATTFAGISLTRNSATTGTVSGCEAACLLAKTHGIPSTYSTVENLFYPSSPGDRQINEFLLRTNPWLGDLTQ